MISDLATSVPKRVSLARARHRNHWRATPRYAVVTVGALLLRRRRRLRLLRSGSGRLWPADDRYVGAGGFVRHQGDGPAHGNHRPGATAVHGGPLPRGRSTFAPSGGSPPRRRRPSRSGSCSYRASRRGSPSPCSVLILILYVLYSIRSLPVPALKNRNWAISVRSS